VSRCPGLSPRQALGEPWLPDIGRVMEGAGTIVRNVGPLYGPWSQMPSAVVSFVAAVVSRWAPPPCFGGENRFSSMPPVFTGRKRSSVSPQWMVIGIPPETVLSGFAAVRRKALSLEICAVGWRDVTRAGSTFAAALVMFAVSFVLAVMAPASFVFVPAFDAPFVRLFSAFSFGAALDRFFVAFLAFLCGDGAAYRVQETEGSGG
jgi:hypothetical protein